MKDYRLKAPKADEDKSDTTFESKVFSKAFAGNHNNWTFSRLDNLSESGHVLFKGAEEKRNAFKNLDVPV